MDQVYKSDLPRYKAMLVELKQALSATGAKTDWARLRIDPLLAHVAQLERLLLSPQFAQETARLRRGVAMFHADLVYLRTNIKALRDLLAVEVRKAGGPARPKRQRRGGRGLAKPD